MAESLPTNSLIHHQTDDIIWCYRSHNWIQHVCTKGKIMQRILIFFWHTKKKTKELRVNLNKSTVWKRSYIFCIKFCKNKTWYFCAHSIRQTVGLKIIIFSIVSIWTFGFVTFGLCTHDPYRFSTQLEIHLKQRIQCLK